jgi:hypothetical protein
LERRKYLMNLMESLSMRLQDITDKEGNHIKYYPTQYIQLFRAKMA